MKVTVTEGVKLQRRALLRGLGVGAALLPVLGRRARASGRPTHLICVVQTGGYLQPEWQPPEGALLDPLPLPLEPLAPHRGALLVMPALIPGGVTQGSRYGSLFHGTAAGAGAFPGAAGATLDQVVGSALGRTRRSLALGVQLDLSPQLDPAPAYRHAFWTGRDVPVEPELDPVATYTRLFGGDVSKGEIAPLLGEGRSILDYVGGSLTRFRMRLGRDDRQRIDLHLQAVRDLEGKLGVTAGGPARSCGNGALSRGSAPPDLGARSSYPHIIDLQCELLVAALRCGITNVATLQLSDATGANVDPSFSGGVPRGRPFTSWRELARANDPASVAAKRRLDRWFMERFARLLSDLQASEAPSGRTLLQESIVVWANDQFDGRTPAVGKVPLLVAQGAFASAASRGLLGSTGLLGRCLRAERPLPGVLAALAETMGVSQHPFGPALAL
jgi:hypothetical protein